MFSATVELASTVVAGDVSFQMAFVWKATISVAAKMAAALVAVPTEISPPVPVEREAEALAEGEIEALGETLVEAEGLTLAEGLSEADGLWLELALADGLIEALGLLEADEDGDTDRLGLVDRLADGLVLSDGEADKLREGDVEALGLVLELGEIEAEALGLIDALGETLALALALGDWLELGEIDALGDTEADAGPKGVNTLANNRRRTAPVTVNRVNDPTAPLPTLPLNVTVLSSAIDQSVSVTGAPFRFCCLTPIICFPFYISVLATEKHTPILLTQALCSGYVTLNDEFSTV